MVPFCDLMLTAHLQERDHTARSSQCRENTMAEGRRIIYASMAHKDCRVRCPWTDRTTQLQETQDLFAEKQLLAQ